MDRIIEIATDARRLSVSRGSLLVGDADSGETVGTVALDDISALICNAHGLSYSNNLIEALATRGVPMVICGRNHLPVAIVWPAEGHHAQSGRMRAQLAAQIPLKKRLWRTLVRAKLEAQSAALDARGADGRAVATLIRKVKAGDPDNMEAWAAQIYWSALAGSTFRRDREAPGLNALLNYGYTILRSATARAVCAAGLHPTLGLHHRGRANPFCLVDDLIEPFRPLVDLEALALSDEDEVDLTPDVKRRLARVIARELPSPVGASPVGACLERLAGSLAKSFESGTDELVLPDKPLPMDIAASGRRS